MVSPSVSEPEASVIVSVVSGPAVVGSPVLVAPPSVSVSVSVPVPVAVPSSSPQAASASASVTPRHQPTLKSRFIFIAHLHALAQWSAAR